LRLISLLTSPLGQGQQFTCTGSLSLPVTVPLLFLFGSSLAQGKTLFGGSVSSPVFVFTSDKLVVWGVFFCSILFFCLVIGSAFNCACPANWLGASTLAFAYVSCPASKLLQTEVDSLQGGGLALLPSLARPLWPWAFTFGKAMVCLCVVCFLV